MVKPLSWSNAPMRHPHLSPRENILHKTSRNTNIQKCKFSGLEPGGNIKNIARVSFCLFVFLPFLFLSFCLFTFLSLCLFFVFWPFCLFVLLSFTLFVFYSFCLLLFLSFCLLLFLSKHYSDQLSKGPQVSKVTLCVQILKWRSVSESVTDQGQV